MASFAPTATGNPIADAFAAYHTKASAMNTGAGRDMSPSVVTPKYAVGNIGKPSEGIGKMSQASAPNIPAYVDPRQPGWEASDAINAAVKSPQSASQQPDSSINKDKINTIVGNLRKDYGLTREQAVGAVGWMGYESGNMSVMQEYGHSGTNSGWGWAQWTGPRRTAFMNYAAANKLDPASDEANYGYLKHELDTSHAYTLPALRKATTVEEANRAWGEGFEGMREGGKGVPAFKEHAQRAALYDTLVPPDPIDAATVE